MDDKVLAFLGDREAMERMNKKGEFIPCPFCGGTEVYVKNIVFRDNEVYGYQARCNDCLARAPMASNRNRAILYWNQRAPILSEEEMVTLERRKEAAAVRPIDSDAMLAELKPITYEMEHSSVTIADMSNIMRNWVERQPTLTHKNETEHAGLYGKYTVRKSSDGQLVAGCFVLRPDKDPVAATALRAYAAATDNTELAADIIDWVGEEPNEPLTLDELLTMDGEPVYVVFRPDSSGERSQSWALVNVDEKYSEVYLVDSIPGASCYYDEV